VLTHYLNLNCVFLSVPLDTDTRLVSGRGGKRGMLLWLRIDTGTPRGNVGQQRLLPRSWNSLRKGEKFSVGNIIGTTNAMWGV
jgi:hypothetical protein